MPDVREQAADILNTCEALLARAGRLPDVDRTTFFSAQNVLGNAQSQNPHDKMLAKTKLDDPWSWTSIQTAMKVVLQSLPARKTAAVSGPRSSNPVTGY
jgi:hypothetical protein